MTKLSNWISFFQNWRQLCTSNIVPRWDNVLLQFSLSHYCLFYFLHNLFSRKKDSALHKPFHLHQSFPPTPICISSVTAAPLYFTTNTCPVKLVFSPLLYFSISIRTFLFFYGRGCTQNIWQHQCGLTHTHTHTQIHASIDINNLGCFFSFIQRI